MPYLFPRSNKIISKYPSECRVVLNPAQITHHARTSYQITNKFYKIIEKNRILPSIIKARVSHQFFKLEPFIKKEFQFKPIEIWSMPTYQKISNFIDEKNISNTLWYEMLSNELLVSGCARHKRTILKSRSEIREFLLFYRNDVVYSLRDKGVIRENKVLEAPTVLVDAKGSFLKSSKGNHRFAIAKKLEIDQFPMVICGVHRKFYEMSKAKEVKFRSSLELMKQYAITNENAF